MLVFLCICVIFLEGGWIGGNEQNRRRSGGQRGGRGFYRGGGQFGENRRNFNRGPRGPTNQQPRSAAVGGSTNQAFAE